MGPQWTVANLLLHCLAILPARTLPYRASHLVMLTGILATGSSHPGKFYWVFDHHHVM